MTPQFLCVAILFGQAPDDPTAFINRHFAEYWQAEKITPANRCSDHEFLRRASLDLIGRIPTLAEIDAFMKEPAGKRRRLLVDRLLDHEDAPRHWANLWTDALLGNAGSGEAREAFHGWLQAHFARNGSLKDMAVKLITAKGTTRDNSAVHFFVAHRGQMLRADSSKSGQYEMAGVTSQVVRAFHGRRIQCVQCHDHPGSPEDIGQHNFWGINAFFRQVEFKRKQVGQEMIDEISDNPEFNKKCLVGYQRLDTVYLFTDPTFLDGKKIPKNYEGTRREAIAEFITTSPWFAKAYVHRMWGHFFGHGLCQTSDMDNFDSDPVVHPKVLDRLTQAFLDNGQDSKALMRWICLSDCYGLSSVANKTTLAPDADVAFARQQVRPLTNAQLVKSLLTAMRFEAGERIKLRRALFKDLYRAHMAWINDCEFEQTPFLGDLPSYRMLWLMNNPRLEEALQRSLAGDRKKVSEPALQTLFLQALSRRATPREIEVLTKAPALRLPAFKTDSEAETFWRSYYADVLWCLLNSGEFALNH